MSVKQNQQNVTMFNQWAKTYHEGRMRRWLRSGQAKTLEAAGLKEDDWLLDVGCGTGWAVMQAAQLVPNGKACGIDLSPGMISKAKELGGNLPNVEFQLADAEAIPYPEESFNGIICTNSFHHYSAPVRALTEMRRVLKPGGRLIIRDQDRGACIWVWFWDIIHRIFEKGHVRYYTSKEVFQLLAEAGLNRTELVASEHSHFRKGKIMSAIYAIRAIEEKS